MAICRNSSIVACYCMWTERVYANRNIAISGMPYCTITTGIIITTGIPTSQLKSMLPVPVLQYRGRVLGGNRNQPAMNTTWYSDGFRNQARQSCMARTGIQAEALHYCNMYCNILQYIVQLLIAISACMARWIRDGLLDVETPLALHGHHHHVCATHGFLLFLLFHGYARYSVSCGRANKLPSTIQNGNDNGNTTIGQHNFPRLSTLFVT